MRNFLYHAFSIRANAIFKTNATLTPAIMEEDVKMANVNAPRKALVQNEIHIQAALLHRNHH